MTNRVLVIGAGIAGIQTSLDIANSGYEVVLVEKEPSIGGHMAQLSETFPTLDCSQCILTPRTVEVGHHENIRLYTYSQVEGISRDAESGIFTARIRRKAAYINWDLCTGCGVCQEKCPFKVESDFERGIGPRKVAYTLSPQAVPNKPVIDAANCRYLQSKWDIEAGKLPAPDKYIRSGQQHPESTESVPTEDSQGNPAKPKCGACAKFCPTGAIDWEQQDKVFEEQVNAVVLATGFDLFPLSRLPEYGGGRIPDVIDGLAFERLLAASGPTAGKVVRPSDGKVPREIVFVQCSGSRDPERGMAYCSKICCMYAAKQGILYKHRVHDGQAYVFYIDVRAGGKGYEEFLNRAQEEDSVVYLRGKVSKIFREGDKVMVWGTDTLSDRAVEVAADMVVLATPMIPSEGAVELGQCLHISTDAYGFYNEAHIKLRPVETLSAGIYLAGVAQGPKDIPETAAQASAAAAKVLQLFSHDEMTQSPLVAVVIPELCAACGACVEACPYSARQIHPVWNIATVNASLCQSCGACVTACPNKASQVHNWRPDQILAMIDEVL